MNQHLQLFHWQWVWGSSFASADSDGSGFPHISTIEDPPASFSNAEHSRYHDIWNDLGYNKFRYLWNSNAFRLLKKGKLP